MYIIDAKKFHQFLTAKGYTTIGTFAKELGLHRNTIHHYLSGNGVFPTAFNKILAALQITPSEVLITKEEPPLHRLQPIAEVMDTLKQKFLQVTFVLFGSRTKWKTHKYADWDIGVFSTKGLSHKNYRKIRRELSNLQENSPYLFDLTNLNNADLEFLKAISRNWIFLGGKLKDWVLLNQRAYEETEEIH